MTKLYPITLSPGKHLQIQGSVPEEADRTSFNLQYGPYANDEPNEGETVALHLDIRHYDDTVVKNHFEVDGWGDEELIDFSGLHPGQQFVIEIKVTPDSYTVQINGTDIGEFKHRVPLEEVTHLLAFHDVTVNSVTLDGQQLVSVN